MGAPVGKIEKERTVFIGFNHLDGFISPVVGQVATGSESVCIAGVEGIGVVQRRPKKLVDGVKGQPGIHHIGIVFRQIEPTGHQQTVVKTLLLRRHAIAAPQMPFTDMGGVIALRLKPLRYRHFRRGQALQIIRGLTRFQRLIVKAGRHIIIHSG